MCPRLLSVFLWAWIRLYFCLYLRMSNLFCLRYFTKPKRMPHHVALVKPTHKERSKDLEKFAITCNAFLPAGSPSELLSDPYYGPWELMAQHLSELIDCNRIRDTVDRLPILQTDRLTSEAEWRRAYVILAFIAHAYVWGGDKPEEVIFVSRRSYPIC